jgi:hypothetical protein
MRLKKPFIVCFSFASRLLLVLKNEALHFQLE